MGAEVDQVAAVDGSDIDRLTVDDDLVMVPDDNVSINVSAGGDAVVVGGDLALQITMLAEQQLEFLSQRGDGLGDLVLAQGPGQLL